MKVAVEYLTLPREGETENGDAALVRRVDGEVLVAVVDALGHGALAAQAAAVATGYLADAPLRGGLRPLIDGLHERLRGTRGAAAMLLLFRKGPAGLLEGCGVGNVSLRSYRAHVPAVLTPGVLGGSLTRLRLFQGEVAAGDRLILFSDGISSRFEEEGKRATPAQATCRAIMERHRRPHDDATVLVIDFEPVHDRPTDSGHDGGDPRTPGPAGRNGGDPQTPAGDRVPQRRAP